MTATGTRYDVRIRAWAGGEFDWFPLASAVPQGTAEVLRKTALWDVETAEAEDATDPVEPVKLALSEADEYAVWMRFPSAGGKVPWGLIADHLTPEQARAYAENPQTQLNIQPAADRSAPAPVDETLEPDGESPGADDAGTADADAEDAGTES